MKIILVRHGQTQDNIDNIVQRPESELTELGRKQAQAIAEELKKERIDAAYVSDFVRTRETANEILKLHPSAELFYTKEIREKNAGIFIGRPLEDQRKAREASGISPYEFKPEQGESLKDLQRRVVRFYTNLIKKNNAGTILIVTHQGPIIMLILFLLDKRCDAYDRYHMANTAMTIIKVDTKKNSSVLRINDSNHLPRSGLRWISPKGWDIRRFFQNHPGIM